MFNGFRGFLEEMRRDPFFRTMIFLYMAFGGVALFVFLCSGFGWL